MENAPLRCMARCNSNAQLKEAFLASQLFAKKSIDKLISDSEDPEHRLKKSCGPWSLTALGIGSIIGSGIFALTGTAAAGKTGDPSFYKVQVLDLFMHLIRGGGLHDIVMYGRPPAGPAIAISFLLVAVACAFAGLCYAELASMIPIAGSAYTYSYAPLGELFAWIIGWDLILEYALGASTIAVGWAGNFVSILQDMGIPFPAAFTGPPGSQIALPDGSTVAGVFNIPAAAIVLLVSMILIIGIKESAGFNTVI